MAKRVTSIRVNGTRKVMLMAGEWPFVRTGSAWVTGDRMHHMGRVWRSCVMAPFSKAASTRRDKGMVILR